MEASNVKAMRDALVIAKKAICHHARTNHTCDSLAWENDTANANCGDILCAHRDLCEAKTAIQKALSEPPRQCNVGTAEEQYIRYKCFCKSHQYIGADSEEGFPPIYVCSDKSCPLHRFYLEHGEDACEFAWAQMPYTA